VQANGAISILVQNPQITFYRLMAHIFEEKVEGGIHPTAVVHPEAEIHTSAKIGPYCVVGRSQIKSGVHLYSHVTVHDNSVIQPDVKIESHSTIGASGVAWVWDSETKLRIIQPQIGGVLIEAGCFIGSDVTIVRGSINERTRIG